MTNENEKKAPKKKAPLKTAAKRVALDWMGELHARAKAVANSAKKMDFYRDARREPPEALSKQLFEQETVLDETVRSLLAKRENLKEDILSDRRFDDESLEEIEFSYQKAVCFGPGKNRAHSRMFFLPCLFYAGKDGKSDAILDFSGVKGQTYVEFLGAFLAEHFGDDDSSAPCISIYHKTLLDWNVQDEEEKMLPALHQAILDGTDIDVDKAFPARAKVMAEAAADAEGWSVAVLPFAVEHDDEGWLESISFEGYDEEFEEEFEEIFDPASALDYVVPCDPTAMQDEAVRHLWTKQLALTVAEMTRLKKPKHIGAVETTFVWDEGEYVGLVMDFKLIDPDIVPSDDEEGDGLPAGVSYYRQMTRQVLAGETPGVLASFLAEYPALMREDFEMVFAHQNYVPEEGDSD